MTRAPTRGEGDGRVAGRLPRPAGRTDPIRRQYKRWAAGFATVMQIMTPKHQPFVVTDIGDQDRIERKFPTIRAQREIRNLPLRSVCPMNREDVARRISIVIGK